MKAEHDKVERLLKTARGQIDGILKMVEEDRYCMDISHQLLATQSILKKVNYEILSAHMLGCVKEAEGTSKDAKIDEILVLLQAIMNK